MNDPILRTGAILMVIVMAFAGIGFLISACTIDADPQERLRQFLVGLGLVFASLISALMIYRKENQNG